MYQNIAILAAFVLVYSAVAGPVERSWISGPIVYTAIGLVLGPYGFGLIELKLGSAGLRSLAEFTLAMVLFTDAANADFSVVRRNVGLPVRLLLIGLPLTIVFGWALAALVLPQLDMLELALLAALLAPTDAALGKPVVTNPAVPSAMREALNLESGLNDGICVPVVLLLLGLAVGTQIEGGTAIHVVRVVAEEIGIGLIVGIGLTWLATMILRLADSRGWTSEHWAEIHLVALAAACYTVAQAAGGSGFIACFAGGLLLSAILAEDRREARLHGAESTGDTLALITWVVFGDGAVGQIIGHFTWLGLLYAVLSLTVIRMLPVFLCLLGTGIGAGDKLFIGWFGPRGLATIVFAIIVLNEQLPGNDTIVFVAAWTILLSVVAHGMTATPLVKLVSRNAVERAADRG